MRSDTFFLESWTVKLLLRLAIRHGPDTNQSRLGREIGMIGSDVPNHLCRLERLGLVTRVRVGRQVIVGLTPKGLKVAGFLGAASGELGVEF